MKPRTKLQQQVLSLSNNHLPNISDEQKKWTFANCLNHVAYRTKTSVSCLDCGNVWDGPQKVKTCTCPSCGVKLHIVDTRKKKLNQGSVTLSFLHVVEGFQVIRFFEVYSYHRVGEVPTRHMWEVVQKWFVPDGKLTVIARTVSYNNTGWGGDLEIRQNHTNYWSGNKYDLYAYKLHPDSAVLPIYSRNGFNTKLTSIHPYTFLKRLLVSPKLETLVKSGQFKLAAYESENKIYTYWNSIKICIRRKYFVKDAGIWLDYLDLLHYFNLDLRSEKYVCPKNLHKEHDRLVAKKVEILRRQREVQELEKAKNDLVKLEQAKLAYHKNKALFFGMVFSEGDITVKVLESVDEFIAESDAHGHCVFTNEYYKKNDSLILSARISDKPIETIEIILSKMKIEQSRGRGNLPTKYNKDIIDLVRKNIPAIKKVYKQLKKAAV